MKRRRKPATTAGIVNALLIAIPLALILWSAAFWGTIAVMEGWSLTEGWW